MLPHYSPLKVAESFTILAALYPGPDRPWTGAGGGTDPLTTFALQRDRRQAAPDDFPQQLAELLAYFEDDLPEDHPFRHLAKSLPGRPELPVPWLLGSSQQSGIWAAELGLRYAFADFINSDGSEIARLYRDRFAAVRDLQAPRTAVAAWVLCAPTRRRGSVSRHQQRMTFTMLRRGQLIAVPAPETAVAFLKREGKVALDGYSRSPGDSRFAGDRPRRGGEPRRRVSGRRGDRRHDHLRPRCPPPFLRAAGRNHEPRAACGRRGHRLTPGELPRRGRLTRGAGSRASRSGRIAAGEQLMPKWV